MTTQVFTRASAPAKCPCNDPECGLPPGRCILCGNPCDNGRLLSVCGDCAETNDMRETFHADTRREARRKHRNKERECFCGGWLLMNEESDGSLNVERCDTCDLFSDDEEAARACAARFGLTITAL